MPNEAFHTVVLSANDNETGVSVTAAEDNTEIILVSFKTFVFHLKTTMHFRTGCWRTAGSAGGPIWAVRYDEPRRNSEDID